jgi:DNA topoisomerase IB
VVPGERVRLIRSDPEDVGICRKRHGRGFSYTGPGAARITDARTLARIKSLVIPPAWEDVWICADPHGHIQAIGTDSAGRRQYRYHDLWREQRDRDKFGRVLEFGTILPSVRAAADCHLDTRGLTRDRVLAAAIRLIDLGFFRPGGEEYAEDNGTFGLATIRKRDVAIRGGQLVFDYIAKGDKRREQAVAQERVCAVVRGLKRRRSPGEDQLLAYRAGRSWREVTAADINGYLGEISGGDYTAKDFRTWHATVLAAVGLAVSQPAASSESATKRAIARSVQEVADYLGNTPAVARASYIDPRVIELYKHGTTIASALGDLGRDSEFGDLATRGRAESATIRMLADSPDFAERELRRNYAGLVGASRLAVGVLPSTEASPACMGHRRLAHSRTVMTAPCRSPSPPASSPIDRYPGGSPSS